jgi:hypothetical protein
MAAKWLYSVDSEGLRVTPEFMERLQSGGAAALRSLNKQNITLRYLSEFTRASRRDDAEGLFWSSAPPTALIPLVTAGRHSPPAWVKKDVLVETIKTKVQKNTYYPPKYLKAQERGQRKMIAFANLVRKSMKRGEGTVFMKLRGTDVTAWNMMPNPKFELVVVNRFDKAALLKLLDELDSATNVKQWLDERTVRQGATAHNALHADYAAWCDQRGEAAAGKKNFAQALIAAGVVKLTRSNAAQRYELELR